jgi:hypothetical protein
VARILTAAGFTDIAITPFDASVPFGEGGTRDAAIDDAVQMAVKVGPLSRVLADQPDDIRARASAAVRAAFAGCPGERSVMIGGAAWIVMAQRAARHDLRRQLMIDAVRAPLVRRPRQSSTKKEKVP